VTAQYVRVYTPPALNPHSYPGCISCYFLICSLSTIQTYLISSKCKAHMWCAMPSNNPALQVLFLSASEEINKRPDEYWTLVMDIAKRNSLGRIKRCGTIMGRDEGEELSAAQIMYPCMQCADIFYLKVPPPPPRPTPLHIHCNYNCS
jgi:hypothetical protein